MLSRVAESLYWMARYIERAEAVARLAAVDFQALLDGTRSGRLEDVIRITSDAALFKSVFPDGDERGVLEFLHTHPANPERRARLPVAGARERARRARADQQRDVGAPEPPLPPGPRRAGRGHGRGAVRLLPPGPRRLAGLRRHHRRHHDPRLRPTSSSSSAATSSAPSSPSAPSPCATRRCACWRTAARPPAWS